MSEIDPHNIKLNFTEEIGEIDSHNVVLNFGKSSTENQTAFFIAEIAKPELFFEVDASPTLNVLAEILIEIPKPILNLAVDSTAIEPAEVSFIANISAPTLNIQADYDFNVDRYTVCEIDSTYQYAKNSKLVWYSKHQAVKQFKSQKSLSFQKTRQFEKLSIDRYQSVDELKHSQNQNWQKADKVQINSVSDFESNIQLKHKSIQTWQKTKQINIVRNDAFNDHSKHRRATLSWWQQAIQLGLNQGFGFNSATWLKLTEQLRYQQTKRPKTGLWIPDNPDDGSESSEEFKGTGDLNFCCKAVDVDPLNVVLNFSEDACCKNDDPLGNQKVYFIMNEGYLKRVDTNENIELKSVNVSIDRDSWCWQFSASLPFTELSKVNTDEDSIEVELMLNGFKWRFLIEQDTDNREIAKTDVKISGRSVTSVLDEQSGTRSFSQTQAISSVQLAQAELDRAMLESLIDMDWKLVDQTGWLVPANAWTYTNLTPIKAIQEIAEGAGGFVSSHMNQPKLLINHRYPFAPWQWGEQTVEYSVPYNLILNISRGRDFKPSYNAVYVQADNAGVQALVKKTGTAGDLLAPTVVDPFINDQGSARSRGIKELSEFGKKRPYDLTIPLHEQVGVILPSKIVSIGEQIGEWKGLSYSVSISANWSSNGLVIRQSATIERFIS